MSAAAERAVRHELANVEDNLYRYRHFMLDGATTGNGETKASVVADLERQRDELRAALAELQG